MSWSSNPLLSLDIISSAALPSFFTRLMLPPSWVDELTPQMAPRPLAARPRSTAISSLSTCSHLRLRHFCNDMVAGMLLFSHVVTIGGLDVSVRVKDGSNGVLSTTSKSSTCSSSVGQMNQKVLPISAV